MSLRVAVAAPFKQSGRQRLPENEFVVSLSLDRGWLSPEQAKRLADIARGEGLLDDDGGDLVVQFDPADVTVPDGFTPDESLFRERAPFEQVLSALTAAGHDKQSAVGAINRLQSELQLPIDAAAVLYARREGVDVGSAAERVREEL